MQVVYVEVEVKEVAAIAQDPNMMPETVLLLSVPTNIAEELAVPASTVFEAPKVIVPSVALLTVSPFRSVIEVVVAPPERVERPVTESVPAVTMLVLIVVAASAAKPTNATETRIETAAVRMFCFNNFIISIN